MTHTGSDALGLAQPAGRSSTTRGRQITDLANEQAHASTLGTPARRQRLRLLVLPGACADGRRRCRRYRLQVTDLRSQELACAGRGFHTVSSAVVATSAAVLSANTASLRRHFENSCDYRRMAQALHRRHHVGPLGEEGGVERVCSAWRANLVVSQGEHPRPRPGACLVIQFVGTDPGISAMDPLRRKCDRPASVRTVPKPPSIFDDLPISFAPSARGTSVALRQAAPLRRL